ncbi:MAG TPA: MAPEG family protein [Steroidobacteraceae bacterium]|nr:MAPEG family protein [Steroidobacteraceae bacterium]
MNDGEDEIEHAHAGLICHGALQKVAPISADIALPDCLDRRNLPVRTTEGGFMGRLTFDNPVFATYASAASLMILLVVATAWITVVQMLRYKSGFRAPEDLKKTLVNPTPNPNQNEPNEHVERWRRIMLNHLENIPFFLVIGLLFVLTGPSLVLAQWLFWGYVVARLLHFVVYGTGQIHDIRATFWTIGSVIIIAMCVMVLKAGLSFV